MIPPAAAETSPASSSSFVSDHDLSAMLSELADESGCELSEDDSKTEPKTYTTHKFDFDSLF